jgi:XTP/dITP diphosphohydrolase
MARKVVLASKNPYKVGEALAILGDIPGVEWLTFRNIALPEVEEIGETLEDNAILKATAAARETGLPALAEDTGLEVEVLGGVPGVRSARFAGEGKDYRANNEKLLKLLSGAMDRRARFRTVAVLALPDGRTWMAEGVLAGRIVDTPRGKYGFGYDPLFVPNGEVRTLAEMLPTEKNAISHRRRALEAMRPILLDLVRGALD